MSSKTSELSQELLRTTQEEGARLAAVSETDAQTRHGQGPGWSRKAEIGHLIDSATNNRVRFVMATLTGSYHGSTYDGEGWVKLGGYDSMSWGALIELWTEHNKALAALIANIEDEKLAAHCQIGSSAAAVTLGFLIEDYILHTQHHLDHLLGREVSTSYPGAAMGV